MINMHSLAAMIQEITHAIAMPFFKNLNKEEIYQKGVGDIVTLADREMEKALIKGLRLHAGAKVFLGEEGYDADKALGESLNQEEPVWVIDPIDGTRNFANGSEDFCVLLARYHQGETTHAFIYQPVKNKMVMAEKGAGAFFENGTPLRTHKTLIRKEQIGQINFILLPELTRTKAREVFSKDYARLDKLRCAGVDYLEQAEGLRHFSLYQHLWWWDHMAGVLVLQESGGMVAPLTGEAYRPCDRARHLLSASCPEVWHQVREDFLQWS